MSVASLVGEIQKLRREVTELSNRVLALEAQLGEHSERGITSPPPITVNYSAGVPVGPLPPFPTFAGGETQSLPASLAPTTPPRSTAQLALHPLDRCQLTLRKRGGLLQRKWDNF